MLLLLLHLCFLFALSEEQQVVCAGKSCPLGFDCITVNGSLQCADPCSRYTALNDTWRAVDNTNNNPSHCDQSINWDGWYRFFLGQTDAHVPQKCVPEQRCGTHAPLWITEPHPTQINQIVNRTVCNAWSGSCCQFPTNTIQVKLCYGYFVYKLTKPSVCNLAYCSEPNPQSPDGFRASGQTESSITLQWNKVSNAVSYVLQFNNIETNISSPNGNGPVNYTVASLTAGTKYTFTLYSVVENIRSSGVQLLAATVDQVVCAVKSCPLGFDCITVNGSLQCADPCSRYTALNDTWRSVNNTNNNPSHCDQSINWDGWYRFFLGQTDAHVPQKCVPEQRCGTHAPLWITEPHPTQINQIVNRTVCNAWSGSCCQFPTNTIQVKLCYGYFVYKLTKPSTCYLAYCSEPNPQSPDGFRASGQTESSITLQWNKVSNGVSYVLQFNNIETNISSPNGNGPVNYTVSSLTAGTKYTFTLYSVVENIRSSAVQLLAATANSTIFTTAQEFNITSCPIRFYQEVYTKLYVNITSENFVICFNNFYGLKSNNDCILGPKPDSKSATFKIREQDSSYETQVKKEVKTITRSMQCGVYFSLMASSQNTELDLLSFGTEAALYFVSTANKVKLVATINVAGSLVDTVTLESGVTGRFIDISGCRVSGVGILPNSTAFFPKTCTTVVCNVNKSTTSTDCGVQQRCNGNGVCMSTTCTVTGPTVIDFNGRLGSIVDRCAYSLVSDPTSGFKLLASFQERRRRDVSFLDSVTLQLDDSSVQIHLEQGGRVQMNNTVLNINSSVQQFRGVQLVKDQTGVTATFSVSKHTTSVFFDGYTAQIRIMAPTGLSLDGLCVDISNISRGRLPSYSSPSCETQFEDPDDKTVNCTFMTERCNILKAAPFSSCNNIIDPTPYINACKNILCRYPSVDHLWCQFLWAYTRACSLNGISVGEAKCSPKAFCQDKTCSDHEFCGTKISGEMGCLCRAVFASKYKQSNTLGDRVMCWQGSGSISLVGCLLEEKDINYTSLHLKDQHCKGVMDKETHMVTFSFDKNNNCGTEIMNSGSQRIYKNAITNQKNSDVIAHYDQIYIDFTCYENQPDMRKNAFRIKGSSVIQQKKSEHLEYTVSIKAYTDRRHTQPVNSNTELLLNQKIWVELKAHRLDADKFALVTDSCWITSLESPYSDPKHGLIKNGCSDPGDETVQVSENGEGTSNYFSFNVLELKKSSGDLYLHCNSQLCFKRAKNCVPVCSSGRKRQRRSSKDRPFIPISTWG